MASRSGEDGRGVAARDRGVNIGGRDPIEGGGVAARSRVWSITSNPEGWGALTVFPAARTGPFAAMPIVGLSGRLLRAFDWSARARGGNTKGDGGS